MSGRVGLDITQGLFSLRFDSDLSEAEQKLQHLREDFRDVNSSMCANAAFFVFCLNDARAMATLDRSSRALSSKQRRLQSALMRSRLARAAQSTAPASASAALAELEVRVGVLGSGRLARQLIGALIAFANVDPVCLMATARSVDRLADLEQLGVRCTQNNAEVAESVDVLFLCCLPAQLVTLAKEIKGQIPQHCLVYSLVGATSEDRLIHLLDHRNILRPRYKPVSSKQQSSLPSIEQAPNGSLVRPLSDVDEENPDVSANKGLFTALQTSLSMEQSRVSVVSENVDDTMMSFSPTSLLDQLRTDDVQRKSFPLGGECVLFEHGLHWTLGLLVTILNVLKKNTALAIDRVLEICNYVLLGTQHNAAHRPALQPGHFRIFVTESENESKSVWCVQDDLPRLVEVKRVLSDRANVLMFRSKYCEVFESIPLLPGQDALRVSSRQLV